MKTSAAGIDLIKRNEGCELEAYLDTIADPPVWTIGYGETGPYVHRGLVWTQEQADAGLRQRLADEFEPTVNAAISDAPTTQAQFDAMVSLAWNIGAPRFKSSTLVRLHCAGDYAGAAAEFEKWNKAGSKVIKALVKRREEERALYLSGDAAAPAPKEPAAEAIDADQLADALAAMTASTKVAQRLLRDAGYYDAKIDGIRGPIMAAAIQAAQREARQ